MKNALGILAIFISSSFSWVNVGSGLLIHQVTVDKFSKRYFNTQRQADKEPTGFHNPKSIDSDSSSINDVVATQYYEDIIDDYRLLGNVFFNSLLRFGDGMLVTSMQASKSLFDSNKIDLDGHTPGNVAIHWNVETSIGSSIASIFGVYWKCLYSYRSQRLNYVSFKNKLVYSPEISSWFTGLGVFFDIPMLNTMLLIDCMYDFGPCAVRYKKTHNRTVWDNPYTISRSIRNMIRLGGSLIIKVFNREDIDVYLSFSGFIASSNIYKEDYKESLIDLNEAGASINMGIGIYV